MNVYDDLSDLTREELVHLRQRIDQRLYTSVRLTVKRRTMKWRSVFRQALEIYLANVWKENPEETEWRGSASHIFQQLNADPLTSEMISLMRVDQVKRFLTELAEEGKCRLDVGNLAYQVWLFPKPL